MSTQNIRVIMIYESFPKISLNICFLELSEEFLRDSKTISHGIALHMFHICHRLLFSLRKHAYSDILKILPPRNVNFQIKKSDIFHISAQNIDCSTR